LPFIGGETSIENRWILALLYKTAGEVNKALENYRFDEAASTVYQFFWGSFCDWYLEIAKLRLDFSPVTPAEELAQREATKEEDESWERRVKATMSLGILVMVFEASLRLLSPFMPFLTEELWHAVYDGNPPAKSIALAIFPKPRETSNGPVPVIEEMAFLQNLITEIRGLRKEIGVEEKAIVPIEVRTDAASRKIAEENRDIVERLARVSGILFVDQITASLSKHSTAAFDVAVVYEKKIDVAADRERLTKECLRLEKIVANDERALNDPGFAGKAPAHIVEGRKKQLAENRLLLEKAKAALGGLPEG
jgi:valyl-tRNA synthetase